MISRQATDPARTSIRSFRFALVVAFAIFAAGGPLPAASAQVPPQVQITSVDASAWPSVQATLTVSDEAGKPIAGLPGDAFTATVAGTPVTVAALNTASDPGLGIAVVLTFDVSGSMAGAPLAEAKAAGAALVRQLGPDDLAAVVSFANEAHVVQTYTPDKGLVLQAIDSLGAGGDTALYDAVRQSIDLSQSAPVPRRAVVILSDGYDFGGVSGASGESTLSAAEGTSTLIFSIGLGPEIDSDYLAALAVAGRGRFEIAPDPASLNAVYETAGAVLRQQYVLTLDAGSLSLTEATNALRIEALVAGASSASEASLVVPASALVPPATPVPAAVEPAPVTALAPDAGGSSAGIAIPWLLLLAALAVAAGGAVWLLQRRRPQQETLFAAQPGGMRPGAVTPEFPAIPRAVGASAEQAWLEGPAGLHTSLGEEPVTIGFGPDCTVTLPNGSHENHERARIWRRDGRYMLHNLSRLGNLTVEGRPVTWVILEDGDEIALGQARLVFRDGASA